MIVTFLGTSAANAYPEAFCSCDRCERARVLGGANLRKRSAVLINDDLLIDLGPDIMTASNLFGIPLTGVRYCLQTHAHSDHLDASHFLSRNPSYGVVGAPCLHFYASTGTLRWAARTLEKDCAPLNFLDPEMGKRLNLELHPVEAFQTFTFGRYRVTAFPANHDPVVEPMLYAVDADGHSMFYGADTATLPEETWQGFHRCALQFDLVILDHTFGLMEPRHDHLSAWQFIEHVARMREEGLLSGKARIVATHIAHEGNPVHPELVEFGTRYGYEIAYDGLVL